MEPTNIDYSETGVKTLKGMAYAVLIIGIIGSGIELFTVGVIKNPAYSYHVEYIVNWNGIVNSIFMLLGSILAFGICLALSTLTNNSLTNKVYMEQLLKQQQIEPEENK